LAAEKSEAPSDEPKKASRQHPQQQQQLPRHVDRHTVPVYEDFLMSEGEEPFVAPSSVPVAGAQHKASAGVGHSSSLNTILQQQQLLLFQQLTDRLARLEQGGSVAPKPALEKQIPKTARPPPAEPKLSRPAKNPRLSVGSLFGDSLDDAEEGSEGEAAEPTLSTPVTPLERQGKLDSSLGLAEQLKVNLVSKKSRNQLSRKVVAAQKSLTNLRQFLESL